MTALAFFGAAGKIGTRIAEGLQDAAGYDTLYVEAAPRQFGQLTPFRGCGIVSWSDQPTRMPQEPYELPMTQLAQR
jgi:nucleoside-diphosphate-sugar epimerase